MAAMDRREFLRLAGSLTGALAVYTFWPHGVFAEGEPKPVLAASAVANPTFISPAIVKRGDGIPFSRAKDLKFTIDGIWLEPSGKPKGGGIIELREETGSGRLAPAAAPAVGMYDLYVKVSGAEGTRIERQPLSVKFVDDFKSDFIFGVISDVHFGDPRVTNEIKGFKVAEVFNREIAILNERGVEFCISCGDYCFTPPDTKNQIVDYVEALEAAARFPVFSVPGNHDGYATGSQKKIAFDTFKYWKKYFGGLYFEAGYGDIEIIGLNTYDKDPLQRNLYGGHGDEVDTGAMSKEQLSWLDGVLKTARAKPDRTIIMFGHQNPTNTVVDVNGPFVVKPFSEEGRRELLDLMKKYEPDVYFNGHVHGIHEEYWGKTRIVTAPTAGSLPDKGHDIGFLIVTVKAGKIDSYEPVTIIKV